MSSVGGPESSSNPFTAVAEQLQLIRTSSELPSDYYEPSAGLTDEQRARITNVIVPYGHKLAGNFINGGTIVYGALADTMVDMGLEVNLAMENDLQPGLIVVGAGMRPLNGPHDERGVQWMRRNGAKAEYKTETDAAEGMLRSIFGAVAVDQVAQMDTPGIEAPNALGPRQWVYRRYENQDGQDFILVNGKSVSRQTANREVNSSQNRHTTRSVMQEIAHIVPEQVRGGELLVMAAALHAVRMGAETAAILQRQPKDPKITVYPVLTSLDKYGVGAAHIAREAYIQNVPEQSHVVEMTPELDPQNGDLLKYANFNAALTLLLLEEPKHVLEFNPGKPVTAYLDAIVGKTAEIRRTFDPSKLIAVPEALDRAYTFLKNMGFGSSEFDRIKDERQYSAAIEGGRAIKYDLEFKTLDEQDKRPEQITVFGTPHRTVGRTIEEVAKEFEGSPHGLTDSMKAHLEQRLSANGAVTEYDLAEVFAIERVHEGATEQILAEHYTLDGGIVDNHSSPHRKVTYWGRDVHGAPVISVMVDREYRTDDGAQSYTALGVGGTLALTDEINKKLVEHGILSGKKHDQMAIAMVSSHFYAPTRRMHIECQNKINQNDRYIGLFYGPTRPLTEHSNELTEVAVRQLVSEFRAVSQSVETLREKAEPAAALAAAR